MDALRRSDRPVLFTCPSADVGHQAIMQAIERFVGEHRNAHYAANLGTTAYFHLMKKAAAMVGNSSSGLIEAASLGLPVVNVGPRQEGRLRARNVIDVPPRAAAIGAAIERAVSPAFRDRLNGLVNPYGDGQAARRITQVLRTVPLDGSLLSKRFHHNAPQLRLSPCA